LVPESEGLPQLGHLARVEAILTPAEDGDQTEAPTGQVDSDTTDQEPELGIEDTGVTGPGEGVGESVSGSTEAVDRLQKYLEKIISSVCSIRICAGLIWKGHDFCILPGCCPVKVGKRMT